MWPFSNKLERKAEEAIARINSRVDELIKSEQTARADLAAKNEELAKVAKQLTELKTKVRAQTEADLYLVSAKIMRDIMEKGKAEVEDISRQRLLQQSYMQQAAQGNPYRGIGPAANPSLFGSILGM